VTEQIKITVEWGFEHQDGQPFRQAEYECESYSVTRTSNLLVLRRAAVLPSGWLFDEIGIPLLGVTNYYVGEGLSELPKERE
jgi:hypothetical protein